MESTVKPLARHPSVKLTLAAALALASSTAAALGLGQIQVKSRLDQPLLAEIPIISSDPAELERLQARLASPETFARIGLEPPRGLVSNLQFRVALDDAGNPVVRVTTAQPVQQPLLTFLVEVDWGQGRLVREYSALLDAPRTVSAPVQPPIQAPVAAPPDTIVRPSPAEAASAARPPAPASAADAPAPAAVSEDAVASVPSPATMPAMAPPAPAADGAGGLSGAYAVQRGDTLSGIAEQLERGGYSLDQAMIALLRSNPQAFIDGNINLLKAGAVLRIPAAAEVGDVGAAEALALVRSQVQQWREASLPVPQPATGEGAGAQPAAPDRPVAAAAPDARLEIVPPGASTATEAGSQSGISAGGEGDMLRQEMQQTRETLAAREAELAEMRSRIEDLEQLQQQQQQLLSMKDSELAAAQQRLAQAGQATAVTEAAPAPALLPWLVGGVGLLLAVLGGWLWSRRTRAPKPVFRAPAAAGGGSSLADAFPSRSLAAPPRHATADRPDPVAPEAPIEQADVARGGRDTSPTWHPGDRPDAAPRPPLDPAAPVPAQAEAGQAPPEPSAPEQAEFEQAEFEQAEFEQAGLEQAAPEPTPAAQERLELARAYLDIGDRDSARQLLDEIAADGDHGARQHAARMLREID